MLSLTGISGQCIHERERGRRRGKDVRLENERRMGTEAIFGRCLLDPTVSIEVFHDLHCIYR